MLIYEPKYFKPQELISPNLWDLVSTDGLYLYHPNILRGADKLREAYGPMIANTWHSPTLMEKFGCHRFRGLREKNCEVGAKYSAHKVGIGKRDTGHKGIIPYSAIDLWPVDTPVNIILKEIGDNQLIWKKYFTRIEKTTPEGRPITWFHGDNKPTNKQGIHFFTP